ncbi:MAG: hypothetical protein DRN20_03330, partial [Thermoplasmata archaeon]
MCENCNDLHSIRLAGKCRIWRLCPDGGVPDTSGTSGIERKNEGDNMVLKKHYGVVKRGARKIMRGKKCFAVVVVAILIISAIILISHRRGVVGEAIASIDEILSTTSSRTNEDYDIVIANQKSPFFALIATPLASYFDGGKHTKPLLVVGHCPWVKSQESDVASSITQFLNRYPEKKAIVIGEKYPELSAIEIRHAYSGDPCEVSIQIAGDLWKHSDTLLIIEKDMWHYNIAVNLVPVASYLNIPVIVSSDWNNDLNVLKDKLGAKYAIACTNFSIPMKTYRVNSIEDCLSLICTGEKNVFSDRINAKPDYIVLANPLDITPKIVLNETAWYFNGTVKSTSTGSTSDPSTNPDAPKHYITIPDDYIYANVILDTIMKFSESPIPGRNA